MKLANGIIRPGIVREVLDKGCIKASAPGLFNVDDTKNYPPIYPFWELFSPNKGTWSTPKKLDEVWIINFSDNPSQLYWLRKDNDDCRNITNKEGEVVEVLCNRDSGGDWASIYFTTGEGWIIRNHDSKINIAKNGDILLSNGMPHRTIKISGDKINIGSENSKHPIPRGDKLVDVLNELNAALSAICDTSKLNPYTIAIGTALTGCFEKIKNMIQDINSVDVYID